MYLSTWRRHTAEFRGHKCGTVWGRRRWIRIPSGLSMNEDSRRKMRYAVVTTADFHIKVGFHQGSALSPFMFAIVIDCQTEQVHGETPWNMLFAGDVKPCGETRTEVEERLEQWRGAIKQATVEEVRMPGEKLILGSMV